MVKVKKLIRNAFLFVFVPIAIVFALNALTACDDIDCCWAHKPCGQEYYIAQECGKSEFVPVPIPVPVPVPEKDTKGGSDDNSHGGGDGSGRGSGSSGGSDCEPSHWESMGHCVSSCVHDSGYGKGKGRRCVNECREYYCAEVD